MPLHDQPFRRTSLAIATIVTVSALMFTAVGQPAPHAAGLSGLSGELNQSRADPALSALALHAVPEFPHIPRSSASIGAVAQTLDLSNGSLVPGNYVPANSYQCGDYAGIAAVPSANEVYVSCEFDASVLELNATSGKMIASLQVGELPLGLAFDSQNDNLYVANSGSANLSIVSTSQSKVMGAIPVGEGPTNITLDSSNEILYVSNALSGNITEISSLSDTVVGQIPLNTSSQPAGLVVDTTSQDLYVAEWGLNSVAEIAIGNGSIIASVPMSGEPAGLGFDPANGDIYSSVYVATNNTNVVRAISGTTHQVVANVSVGFYPTAIIYDASTGLNYVAVAGTDQVVGINGSSQSRDGSATVGYVPDALALDNELGAVFVADWYAGSIAVVNVDFQGDVRFESPDTSPDSIAVDQSTGDAFVASWDTNLLEKVNGETDQEVATVLLPALGSQSLAVNSTSGQVYVACGPCNQVFEINVSSGLPRSAPVGGDPTALAYDSLNGQVYSGNSEVHTNYANTNAITDISSQTDAVLGNLSLGAGCCGLGGGGIPGIAVDQTSGDVYVAVAGDLYGDAGNVTIVKGSTDRIVGAIDAWVQQGPSALAVDYANDELYVTDNIANVLRAFDLSNGSLVSTTPVGPGPDAVAVDPLNGYVYVADGGSENVSVINGSTNQLLGPISVGVAPSGVAFEPLNGDILVTNYGSGTLSVITGAYAPVATLTESGLPTGTAWWVNVTGQRSENSTGTTIAIPLADGTYTYSVGSANEQYRAPGGTFELNGATESVSVVFSVVTFELTFTETGLPVGALWGVTLNGTQLSSMSPWLNFTEVPGSYPFTVGVLLWYASTPAIGQVWVVTSNQTIRIAFAHVLDQFLIAESNLPASTNWSMTLGHSTEWSTQPWLEFNVTNGTYSYSIPAVDGYAVTFLTHSDSDAVGFRLATSDAYSGQLQIYTRWVNATLEFTKEPGTSGTGGLWGLSEVDWMGVAALIVVAAAVTFFVIRRHYPPAKAGPTVGATTTTKASKTPPADR
jgi:YVTN family beta-propeller protein